MPSPEDISIQQEFLRIQRHNLALYLKQLAIHSTAYVPPSITYGIDEAREAIQRIKGILDSWGIVVEDHPDDSPSIIASPVAAKPHEVLLLGGVESTAPIIAGLIAIIADSGIANNIKAISSDALNLVASDLAAKLGQATVEWNTLKPSEDIQSTFRDAVRAAVNTIGGSFCFPDFVNPLPYEDACFTARPEIAKLLAADSDLAIQVREQFQVFDEAFERYDVVPLLVGRVPAQDPLDARTYFYTGLPDGHACRTFYERTLKARFQLEHRQSKLTDPHTGIHELEKELEKELLPITCQIFQLLAYKRPHVTAALNYYLLFGLHQVLASHAGALSAAIEQINPHSEEIRTLIAQLVTNLSPIPPDPPAPMPIVIPLYGRDIDIMNVESLLDRDGRCWISGAARVGKTVLAAHIVQNRPDVTSVFHFTCHPGTSILDIASSLASWLYARNEFEPQSLLTRARTIGDEDQLITIIRSWCEQHVELVWLDDLDASEREGNEIPLPLAKLIAQLMKITSDEFSLLITSRSWPSYAELQWERDKTVSGATPRFRYHLALEGISSDAAHQLLRAKHFSLSFEYTNEVWRLVEGNPQFFIEAVEYVQNAERIEAAIEALRADNLPGEMEEYLTTLRSKQLSDVERRVCGVIAAMGEEGASRDLVVAVAEIDSYWSIQRLVERHLVREFSDGPTKAYIFSPISQRLFGGIARSVLNVYAERAAVFYRNHEPPHPTRSAQHFLRVHKIDDAITSACMPLPTIVASYSLTAHCDMLSHLLQLLETQPPTARTNEQQMQLLIQRAAIHELLGEYPEGYKDCQKCETLIGNTQIPITVLSLYATKAELELRLERYGDCKKTCEDGLEQLADIPAARVERIALQQRRITAELKIERDRVRQIELRNELQDLINTSHNEGGTLLDGALLGNLALFALNQGDYELAEDMGQKSYDIHKERWDIEGLISTRLTLGQIAKDFGRVKEAIEHLDYCYDKSLGLGLYEHLPLTLMTRGDLRASQSEYSLAFDDYGEAFSILTRNATRLTNNQAQALTRSADMQLLLKKPNEASTYANQILQQNELLPDYYGIAHRIIGEVMTQQKEFDLARLELDKAGELLEQAQADEYDKLGVRIARVRLALAEGNNADARAELGVCQQSEELEHSPLLKTMVKELGESISSV